MNRFAGNKRFLLHQVSQGNRQDFFVWYSEIRWPNMICVLHLENWSKLCTWFWYSGNEFGDKKTLTVYKGAAVWNVAPLRQLRIALGLAHMGWWPVAFPREQQLELDTARPAGWSPVLWHCSALESTAFLLFYLPFCKDWKKLLLTWSLCRWSAFFARGLSALSLIWLFVSVLEASRGGVQLASRGKERHFCCKNWCEKGKGAEKMLIEG